MKLPRQWLAIIIICNIISFTAILIFVLLLGNKEITRQIEHSSEVSLNSLKQTQKFIFDHTLNIFKIWEQEIKTDSTISANSCSSKKIQAITSISPIYFFFAEVDLQGKVVCGQDGRGVGADVSDRIYLQEAIQEKEMKSGSYQIGKVTGEPSINFAYPVLNEQGDVEKVLVLALSLEKLNERIKEIVMSSDTDLYITDSTGTILVTTESSNYQTGTRSLPTELMSLIFSQKQGKITGFRFDNEKKLIVYGPFFNTHESSPDTFILLTMPLKGMSLLYNFGIYYSGLYLGIIIIQLGCILLYKKVMGTSS